MNLCSDQLVLALADRQQIAGLTRNAVDPETQTELRHAPHHMVGDLHLTENFSRGDHPATDRRVPLGPELDETARIH